MYRTLSFSLPFILASTLSVAQDAPASGMMVDIPEACRTASEASGGMNHGMMAEPMQMPEGATASAKGYGQAMQDMHGPMMQAMMIEDPDLAFACGMIPHHLGAIAMAKTVQETGSDDEIKTMAQAMIDAQTKEIEELKTWIEAHARK